MSFQNVEIQGGICKGSVRTYCENSLLKKLSLFRFRNLRFLEQISSVLYYCNILNFSQVIGLAKGIKCSSESTIIKPFDDHVLKSRQ